jgi:hypothetical protein
MKKYLVLATLCFVMPLFARKEESKPTFENNYIKMATQGGLCGGVTLVPNPNALVRVQSQRFSEGLFSSTVTPGKTLSKWVEIPAGGLRVRYDWAGTLASAHYRIFCQKQNERGHWMPVDCSQVLKLEGIKHNSGCVIGPLGPSAEYGALNMQTSEKAKKE